MKKEDLITNRKAFYHYEVLDSLEAGIVLIGTEIKSLRDGLGNLQDNFINIKNNEAWLEGLVIPPYQYGNVHNHEERRSRKLLLHKGEIGRLERYRQLKGYALVALALYWKKGKIKVKVGICKGKKLHDKRRAIQKKEDEKTIARAMKESSQ